MDLLAFGEGYEPLHREVVVKREIQPPDDRDGGSASSGKASSSPFARLFGSGIFSAQSGQNTREARLA
jgi:hypothetical protein